MNLFATRLFSGGSVHPQVLDWIRRVRDVGVTDFVPETNTFRALNNFCAGMDAYGLVSKVKAINCFVPDNITASFVPLYANYGSSSWENWGFVPSDLTINGLKGDGVAKHLRTGIIPSIAMPNVNSGGLSVYTVEGNNLGAIELGGFGSSYTSDTFNIYVDWTDGNTYWDCYGATLNRGRCYGYNSGWNGFTSGNRYASTASYVARGGSQTYGQLQILATSNGTSDSGLSTYQLFCMTAASNQSPGSVAYYSEKRISFAAVHEGFPPGECLQFFNLVHTMRQEMGGGYA